MKKKMAKQNDAESYLIFVSPSKPTHIASRNSLNATIPYQSQDEMK